MIEIGPNSYGKSAIRLVKIVRGVTPHRVRDLTIAIALEGDFAASYVDGDNSAVIATDTMKNTAYALAGEHLTGSIEDFGTVLARHFLEDAQVDRVRVSIDEHAWQAIGNAPDAFSRDGSWTRTARLSIGRNGADAEIRAGIADLVVMKTSRSAFAGFPRDRFTTLKDTDDRIMATKISASWAYGTRAGIGFDPSFEAVRATLLEAFADHHSVSVQASIWIVGKAILERHPEVAEVTMSLPNLHHWTVDLSPFGIENDREVYVSTSEPHGLIEATIRRTGG
ncbi:MAG: urate oxidase [Chloroflexota bacterium]|nr:urate oxidase [Chloroflexota bacterium]MEA2606736.1 urate oxidase [Chloroflexota bacterium]